MLPTKSKNITFVKKIVKVSSEGLKWRMDFIKKRKEKIIIILFIVIVIIQIYDTCMGVKYKSETKK